MEQEQTREATLNVYKIGDVVYEYNLTFDDAPDSPIVERFSIAHIPSEYIDDIDDLDYLIGVWVAEFLTKKFNSTED